MASTPYPFDPTGVVATNKIVGEQQILTAANHRDFHFVVPDFAPFFAEGLVVKHRDLSNVVRTLVEGVDFYTTHWFISASRGCAKPIYGSISFLDLSLTGVIILEYQTLGGVWTQTSTKIAEILADVLHNPRTTAFDVVIDMPVSFPVIDHAWDLADMVGMSQMVEAVNEIADTLRQTGAEGINDHMARVDNPHSVTKAQVGLGSVQNYPIADGPTAIAGVSASHYVTPFALQASLDAGPNAAIATHVARVNNPHGVTAAQVSAYTQAQTNTLLGQKLATNGVAYDTTRFDGKTATEYRDWVLLGASANTLKFSGLTYGEAKADILSGMAANSERFGNMTVQEFKDTLSSEGIGNANRFGGYTYAEAKADILLGTAANASKLENSSKADVVAEARSGTAANASKVYNLNQEELVDLMRTEVGGWEDIIAEQSAHAAQTAAAAGAYRWTHIATIPDFGVDSINQSNPAWLVTGASKKADSQLDVDFQDCAYLVHCAIRRNNGTDSSEVYGTTSAIAINKASADIQFGVVQTGNVIEVWMRTAGIYRGFCATQLMKGVDILTNIDDVASVVDVAPAGIRYGTSAALATAESVSELRTEVEQSLQALTTAFVSLKDQIEAS